MKKNGIKLIAIGLALSNSDRMSKINMLNDSIESIADAIRSSSDVDGMPHGTVVGDPVASRSASIEDTETERDAEQERVNAVVWAEQYVRDIFKEEDGDNLIKAIYLNLNHKYKDALYLISETTSIKPTSFHYAKEQFLKQILLYLHLWQE